MNGMLRFLHIRHRSEQMSRLVTLLACLLIGIRFAAGIIHAACFVDWEKPQTRSFYLHSGDSHDRCHHGQAPPGPWAAWGCEASQDEPGFTLPEIPCLPVIVSIFVPLLLFLVSYDSRSLIAAHGRGPPAFHS
ncbi:MAG: hypothetical protein ABL960_12880 [Nitrospira sp.]